MNNINICCCYGFVCVWVCVFYFVIAHLPVQMSACYAVALCALEFSIISLKPLHQVHQVSVKHLCFISECHHCHLHHQPTAQQSSGCIQELKKMTASSPEPEGLCTCKCQKRRSLLSSSSPSFSEWVVFCNRLLVLRDALHCRLCCEVFIKLYFDNSCKC